MTWQDPYRSREFRGRPRASPLTLIVLLALAGVLGVLAWRTFSRRPVTLYDEEAKPRLVAARGELAGDEIATIALFETASPSVVNVTTIARRHDSFSLNVLEIPQGTGSGIMWDENGYVVTNFHVVEGGQSFKVTLHDGEEYEALYVGGSRDRDLAVLKIVGAPAEKLRPILLGSSSDLRVGQKVFAIGNPFGLDQTLTTGVISGLNREIRAQTGVIIRGVIQTDAAINPGNSGGPLLDSAGRLIGVNTAIVSPSGAYAGVGFAIPVDTINRVVPQIIRQGRPERAGLGITLVPDPWVQQFVEQRKLPLQGALVWHVNPLSAAERAGLRPSTEGETEGVGIGDLIVAVDGERVTGSEELRGLLAQRDVGEEVTLTVLRMGREIRVPVTLQPIN